MQFHTRYNPPPSVGISIPPEASMVQEQFKDETMIDNIIRKYNATGVLVDPLAPRRQPIFGDFSDIDQFRDSQDLVARTTDYFSNLPAAVRAEFGNSVNTFAEFVNNPANEQRLIDLGLCPPKQIDSAIAPDAPSVTSPTASGAGEPSISAQAQ